MAAFPVGMPGSNSCGRAWVCALVTADARSSPRQRSIALGDCLYDSLRLSYQAADEPPMRLGFKVGRQSPAKVGLRLAIEGALPAWLRPLTRAMARATSELSGLREHSQNVKFNLRCESLSSNQVSTTPRTLLRSNVLQDGIEHIIYYLQRNIWEDAWKSYIVVATGEPGRNT